MIETIILVGIAVYVAYKWCKPTADEDTGIENKEPKLSEKNNGKDISLTTLKHDEASKNMIIEEINNEDLQPEKEDKRKKKRERKRKIIQ